jgi:DNA-binding transcriptional MocR family regulator
MGTVYIQVAERLAERIRTSEFLPGEKLPSLRTICRQEQVSLMTAVAALAHLEALGFVESRPRSGFRVKPPSGFKTMGPQPMDLWGERAGEGQSEVAIAEVVNGLSDPELVPLGAGCPSPELFPNAQIDRIIRQVLRKDGLHSAKYSTVPGDFGLRREICRRLSSRRCRMEPTRVLLTAGGMEALAIALGTLVKPGDKVLVEVPTFFGIHQVLRRLHVEVREAPSDMSNGIHLESVATLVRRERITAAVVMPNFNNPTGTLLADEKKRELVRLLARADVAIVEDDIYSDLGYRHVAPRPLLSFRQKWASPHLVVGSFSKTIGPGFRIGYIASSHDIFNLSLHKFTTNVGNNRLAELVIAEALKSGLYEKHVRKLAAAFEMNVKRFRHAILSYFPKGTTVSDPQGGFVVWVRLPEPLSALSVYRASLEAKVSVAPGFIFSTRFRLDRFIRFNAGASWDERVESAVRAVGGIACRMMSDRPRRAP